LKEKKMKKIQVSNDPVKILHESHSADVIPGECFPWRSVLPKVHRISQNFGYQRVETSPIESIDALHTHKEAWDFLPEQCVRLEADFPAARKLALRPHNFLSVLRAYVSNQVFEKERTTKWYYIAPTFTQDKDALLHLYEFGLVHFGEPTPMSEAQMIATLDTLLSELGVAETIFEINSKGCEQCAPYYYEVLSDFLQQHKYELCPNCQQIAARELARNRRSGGAEGLGAIFSCTCEQCQAVHASAPQILDHLDVPCNHNLACLLEALDELGVAYQLNPRLFGPANFSHMLFRVKALPHAGVDKEVILGVGGRYSRLVAKVTGREIPTLSFSIPLSALFQLIEGSGLEQKIDKTADVFLINLGELAAKKSLRLFMDLWHNNISVTEQFGENGIKNQFKLAEKKGCPIALIIGQKEAMEGLVILRDTRSGIQEVFSYDRIIEEVRKRLQD
jgi:histidyl-tRNA synthetase